MSSSPPDPATARLALDGGSSPHTRCLCDFSGPQLGVLESQAARMLCPCGSGQTPQGRVQGHSTCASTRTPGKLWAVPLEHLLSLAGSHELLVRLVIYGAAHRTMRTQPLPSLLVGYTGYKSEQPGGRGAEDKACGEGCGAAIPPGEPPPPTAPVCSPTRKPS